MRRTLVSTLTAVLLPVSWAASTGSSGTEITTVQSLTLERRLTPGDILSTLPAVIPQPAAGVPDIRERFVYSSSSGTVNYIQYSVPAGTPIPTPSSVDFSGSTYLTALLAVQKVSVGSNPAYPSVQFSGTIASTAGPHGSITGTPATLSFGYTNPTVSPAGTAVQTFNDVMSSISGVSSGYSAAGVGEMKLTQVPISNNPCSGPVVITPSTLSTTTNFISLDASQSFDCSGLPLTYRWDVLTALGSVTIYNPTSPKAAARLNAGPGQYTFTVTASDANGVSATSSVLVTYTNP